MTIGDPPRATGICDTDYCTLSGDHLSGQVHASIDFLAERFATAPAQPYNGW